MTLQHSVWAEVLSILNIIRSMLRLLSVELPFTLLVALEFLMVFDTIAITLMYIQVVFYEYLVKVVLKRIPGYKYDFLITWSLVATPSLALFLGALQVFEIFSLENLEDQVAV